jgi:hypothetical protein
MNGQSPSIYVSVEHIQATTSNSAQAEAKCNFLCVYVQRKKIIHDDGGNIYKQRAEPS